jgi:hypothetical protein
MNAGVIVGNYGMAQVRSYLDRRGYMCSTSPEGQPTDLVVTRFNDGGMISSSHYGLQVKTTEQDKASVKLVSKTTSGSVTKDNDGEEHNNKHERDYIPGDFDIMCIYVAKIWKALFIPYEFAKKEILIKIRPHRNGCKEPFYYYTDFLSMKKALKYIDERQSGNESLYITKYRMRFDGSSPKEDRDLIKEDKKREEFLSGIWQYIRTKGSENGYSFNEISPNEKFSLALFPSFDKFEDSEIMENVKVSTTKHYGEGKKTNVCKENGFFT